MPNFVSLRPHRITRLTRKIEDSAYQCLYLEPRDFGFFARNKLQQGWLAFLSLRDSTLYGGNDFLRSFDPFPVSTKSLCHVRVVAGYVRATKFLGRERHNS